MVFSYILYPLAPEFGSNEPNHPIALDDMPSKMQLQVTTFSTNIMYYVLRTYVGKFEYIIVNPYVHVLYVKLNYDPQGSGYTIICIMDKT